MKNSAKQSEYSLLAADKKPQPKVSIVMPAHNEASLLPVSATDIYEVMRDSGFSFELIICENGSTDETRGIAVDLAEEFENIKVLSSKTADYGSAIKAGILAARAPYIFVFDVDYYDLDFLKHALKFLKKYDIVVASKLAPEANDKRSVLRRFVTRAFRLALKMLFGTGVSETHGMKAFRRKKVAKIIDQTRLTKDLFDTELIIRAERSGFRIKEVPATVEEKRPTRSNILKRIPRTLAGLLLLRYSLWKERF